ncbi:MAG: replicative DNA helicase [Candidatus Cloacimonadota bacterium]|nr:MAG: replicative DNA helicase [Candidatus Cloacimonadota bacterium]
MAEEKELLRTPPQSLDAEAAVLGSMLTDREAVDMVLSIITTDDVFYSEFHQRIFRAIVIIEQSDVPVDILTVSEQLRKMEQLKKIGGLDYLQKLVESVVSTTNVQYHAKIVLEKFVLRRLISISNQIIQQSYDEQSNVDELLDRAEQLIFNIHYAGKKQELIMVRDILSDTIDKIDKLAEHKTHITGIESGINKLDDLTGGFQKADFVIIAGRPSMGKTAFALDVALHTAIERNIPVGFFSLEMSQEQLVQRMLAMQARVDLKDLRRGFLTDESWARLTRAAGKLHAAPLYIDDSARLNHLELRAKARRLKSRIDVGIIFIDYLQLLDIAGRSDSRQQEVAIISRSLKALSKELGIPVVALSQLSRAHTQRQFQKPLLSDLRESGAIEQDADVVIFLYRKKESDDPNIRNKVEIIIRKQRNGPTGTVYATFLEKCATFEDAAWEEEPGGGAF